MVAHQIHNLGVTGSSPVPATNAIVAQLVEYRSSKPGVASSNLACRTTGRLSSFIGEATSLENWGSLNRLGVGSSTFRTRRIIPCQDDGHCLLNSWIGNTIAFRVRSSSQKLYQLNDKAPALYPGDMSLILIWSSKKRKMEKVKHPRYEQLVEERQQLRKKLQELKSLLSNPDFGNLEDREQSLIIIQAYAMELYSQILLERLS